MLKLAIPELNKIVEIPHGPVHAVPEYGLLISQTVLWPDVSLLAFLHRATDTPHIYWENECVPLGFAGHGVAAVLTAAGPDRFQTVQRKARALFQDAIVITDGAPHAIGPRLFGGFAFQPNPDTRNGGGAWSAFGDTLFILPHIQLTRFQGRTWLTVNRRTGVDEDPIDGIRLVRQQIRTLRAATDRAGCNGADPAVPQAASPVQVNDLMSRETWCRLVSDAIRRIRQGEMDKVVLARARQVWTRGGARPLEILARLKRRYPGCYRFLFEPVPGHAFYGATPELLGEVTGRHLRAVALAGSIRRGDTLSEDEALGQQLMESPKERWEHRLVVRDMRDSLSPLTTRLEIATRPELHRLSNIQHLRTPIQGELTAGTDTLTVVEALHPTPAVGGLPRQPALQLISQVEPTERGWYAGPVGWMDHRGHGMFAVAIRSAVSVGDETRLYAGAGIVADSVPEREWEETQLKFRPLMDALGGETVGASRDSPEVP